jgi:hypothetical protein
LTVDCWHLIWRLQRLHIVRHNKIIEPQFHSWYTFFHRHFVHIYLLFLTLKSARVSPVWDMTFGGRNLRGQNIPVAWQNNQNRWQQRIAVTVTISWFLICWAPLFYERWTCPTVFRLRTPPPSVISQAGLTLPNTRKYTIPRLWWIRRIPEIILFVMICNKLKKVILK